MRFSRFSLLALSTVIMASSSVLAASSSNNDDDLLSDDGMSVTHNIPDDSGPSGFYIQAGAGYALTYISDRIGTIVGSSWTRHAGGVMGGGDIGYQFNNIFAIEGGGFYLPSTDVKINATGASSSFKTWAGYIAGKMRVFLYENTHLFAKVGVSYERTNLSGTVVTSTSAHQSHTGVMLGFGTEYNFTPSFTMSLQYVRIPGKTRSTATLVPPTTNSYLPDSNIMMISLGYMFGQGSNSHEGSE